MRKAAEGEDAAAMQAAVEKLNQESHKVAESLYKKTAAGSETPPPPPGGTGTDDVVDAEYTVKN